MAIITDLTNTTWKVIAGWKAEAGYGVFNIEGGIRSFSFDTSVPDNFRIGYNTGSHKADYITIYENETAYGITGLNNTFDLLISITGGLDVSNEKLISWLTAYGELQENKPAKTFDLSTLNLSAGTHKIMVKARASGLKDSVESGMVSYVVEGATSEFWGKFTFDQDLGTIQGTEFPTTNVNFTSNGKSYTRIRCDVGKIYYDKTTVYDNGWKDEAYRSINYGGNTNNKQKVDKRFGDWFEAHTTVVADEGGCFVAGTLVLMADGSMKAIENVVCGDEVLTYDEGTKQYDKGCVLGTIIHHTSKIARLTFASGATVDLTPGHPIYTKEGWKSLKEDDGFEMLKLGNMGLSINDEYDEIVSIEYYTTEAPIKVYNLTIEGEHNYFVGEASVLCHNAGSK